MKTSEWRNVLIVIISLRFQTAVKKAYAIDTNMTQNGGQQSCTESPEELEKASMQVSALLCNLLQTSQVPPLGERKCSDTAVINADSQVAGANMVQLEHLKALLSSIDPIILKQLLVEILKG